MCAYVSERELAAAARRLGTRDVDERVRVRDALRTEFTHKILIFY